MYSLQTKITAFLDYRRFLSEVEVELRARGEFSHRKLNRACGFTSPNYLQLVIQGKRGLTEDSIAGIAKTFGMSVSESRLFAKMVRANDEKIADRKVAWLEDLLRDPLLARAHRLSERQLQFYARWYNIPIRELLRIDPTLEAAAIAALLVPAITESEAAEALENMEILGLIARGSEGRRVLHPTLDTGNEILSVALKEFHRAMLERARESLAAFRGNERDVSALTLQLTEADFARLREKLRELKDDILAREDARGPEARVYQLGIQLFPVSRVLRRKETSP